MIFFIFRITGYSCIRLMISSVIISVESEPPMSAVRQPSAIVRFTACSIIKASFSICNENLNIKAALRIIPIGLAIPFPAISGADP